MTSFTFGPATCRLSDTGDGRIYVTNVVTAWWARGEGHARAMLVELGHLADALGARLAVHCRDDVARLYLGAGFRRVSDPDRPTGSIFDDMAYLERLPALSVVA
jgi:hypothetical protein